jgi:hypothetical protein
LLLSKQANIATYPVRKLAREEKVAGMMLWKPACELLDITKIKFDKSNISLQFHLSVFNFTCHLITNLIIKIKNV